MRAKHAHIGDHKEGPDHDGPGQEAPAGPDKPTAEQEEIAKLRQDLDHAQDQLLRTLADMQNVRKRANQEALLTRQLATEDLVRELLPVLDNFERTIEAGEQGASVQIILEGVKAVDRQLRAALERRNVTRIKAQGEIFDPDLHEAIATETAHELPEDTIIGELEAGYKMAEKVIRPARVRVARKP